MDIFLVIVGLFGVAINLVAYAMLTSGKLLASDARYQIVNIAGTSCILLSLIAQWNLPSFVANVAWLLIGIAGLVRIKRLGRNA
jgi:uncharacterized membrane protein YuzA (DUF378 family)